MKQKLQNEIDATRVYLCGPINGCDDATCNDWRTYAKEHLQNCVTLDPMRRDYRGRETAPGIAAEIVGGDEADVRECDIILASCPKPSWGTAMELRMAKAEFGKIVFAVIPRNVVPSPWLLHHCDALFNTIQDAVMAINGQNLSNIKAAKAVTKFAEENAI